MGFSRGADEARIFANLVDRFLAGDDEFTVIDDAGWNNEMAHFNIDAQARAARAFLLAACHRGRYAFAAAPTTSTTSSPGPRTNLWVMGATSTPRTTPTTAGCGYARVGEGSPLVIPGESIGVLQRFNVPLGDG